MYPSVGEITGKKDFSLIIVLECSGKFVIMKNASG